MSSQKNRNTTKKNNIKTPKFNAYWIYGLILAFIIGYQLIESGSSVSKNLSRYEFEKILVSNEIDKILIINKEVAEIFIKKEALDNENHQKSKKSISINSAHLYNYDFGDLQNFENQLEKYRQKNELDFDLSNAPKINLFDQLLSWLPFVLLIGLWIYLSRRMSGSGGGGGSQIFSIGKSKAKLFDKDQKVKTTFKNVAGLDDAKEELKEIVDFLKTPEKYTSLGGKIPKGALLVGPPGTGKTLLAKAVAGEAGVPFFSISGSDFVEMFVGVGASRVRDLFKQAKQKSPAIIFIDEIDAIGRARGKSNMAGGNDERENTLNQLLTEMDGFGTDLNVIVIAATNRSEVLDKALMRAGRFDRQIYVDLPDLKEREEIFKVHLKPLKLNDDIDTEFLAQQTPGFSGADIANLCNEAALGAARMSFKNVHHQNFLDAVDRIVGGLEKKNKIIKPKEKKTIAYHEAGHATTSWMLEHADPLVKVTIVPRGQSLGAAWYLPEERQIVKKSQILDQMCTTLAGRAAEELIFDEVSTGALNDLEKVTQQARALVTIYGLNDKIGNLTYYNSNDQGEYGFTKPYSEETAHVIDKEISKIIETQYQRALSILKTHKDKLTILAETLLEKEVIFKKDLEDIFGKRPFEEEVEIVNS